MAADGAARVPGVQAPPRRVDPREQPRARHLPRAAGRGREATVGVAAAVGTPADRQTAKTTPRTPPNTRCWALAMSAGIDRATVPRPRAGSTSPYITRHAPRPHSRPAGTASQRAPRDPDRDTISPRGTAHATETTRWPAVPSATAAGAKPGRSARAPRTGRAASLQPTHGSVLRTAAATTSPARLTTPAITPAVAPMAMLPRRALREVSPSGRVFARATVAVVPRSEVVHAA